GVRGGLVLSRLGGGLNFARAIASRSGGIRGGRSSTRCGARSAKAKQASRVKTRPPITPPKRPTSLVHQCQAAAKPAIAAAAKTTPLRTTRTNRSHRVIPSRVAAGGRLVDGLAGSGPWQAPGPRGARPGGGGRLWGGVGVRSGGLAGPPGGGETSGKISPAPLRFGPTRAQIYAEGENSRCPTARGVLKATAVPFHGIFTEKSLNRPRGRATTLLRRA